ncbi:hypothetical protein BA896_021985 [Janthinobacterium lividum]|uniref:Uncharacterized protein n=1 Tax=Janthinobacterium lividum TaxID=29581 RepID=A0A1E8PJP0_9BURK|nr:hypothetical protein BA896_021985 [Janthinobacterium lividum]
MNFQIELWHIVTLIITLTGAFWTLISLIVRQFDKGLDKRFDVIDVARTESDKTAKERFDRIEESQRTQERDLLLLKAELPERYVRREDAIRSEMTLHAKFDGLASRIDMFLRATQ